MAEAPKSVVLTGHHIVFKTGIIKLRISAADFGNQNPSESAIAIPVVNDVEGFYCRLFETAVGREFEPVVVGEVMAPIGIAGHGDSDS